MPFLQTLNPSQQKAVTYGDGPLLILAGAGSGKTKVLTSRIAYLVNYKGVRPDQILAVTFTNKAAGEMRERLHKLIGEKSEALWLGTFHSLGLRILKTEMRAAGLVPGGFTIIDDEGQEDLVSKIVAELSWKKDDFPAKAVVAYINQAKNEYLSPAQCLEVADSPYDKGNAKIYSLYSQRLKKQRYFDFGDLICDPINLFKALPETLKKYQEMFRYILVDEYQDTNKAQYILTNLLASASRNILAVGDPDQAIYGWRGADISNIMNFERDYPETSVHLLEQNYRSTKNILAAANSVIVNNAQRMDKSLWTDNVHGPRVIFKEAFDPQEEVRVMVDSIRRMRIEDPSIKYKDIAVFYRTNFQSRAVEEVLIRAGLPYVLLGGFRFYDRAEIKDVLAFLKLAVNPDDSLSLRRVLNTPKRGAGDKSFDKLEEISAARQISAYEALKAGYKENLLKRVTGLDKLCGAIDEFVAAAGSGGGSLYRLVMAMLKDSGYLAHWKKKPEDEKRIENIEEFVSSMSDFESKREGATLQDFLEHVALVSDVDAFDTEKDHLTLMTLHSAKGLEFPVVFMLGMNEGVFPHHKSMMEAAKLEEERRLCYVGMTRAREKLYMICSQYRMTMGEFQYQEKSRFINEIDPEYIDCASITQKAG